MTMANSEPAGIGTQCTCSPLIIKESIQLSDDSGNNRLDILSLKPVIRLRQLFFWCECQEPCGQTVTDMI